MRNKLQINGELHHRAKECAACIDVTFIDFTRRCFAHHARGTASEIVPDDNLLSAKRDDPIVTIHPTDLDPADARTAIARATLYAESRRPAPYTPPGIEGKDFILETE